MEVPSQRKNLSKHNLLWLSRNLSIRNSQHTNFGEAATIIRRLLKNKEYER